MLRDYYRLTKPGIIRGNLFTGAAGFLLASAPQVALSKFAAFLGGLALIIAAACVYNNCLDKDIDSKMKRTQNRPLVTGAISVRSALIYATILLLAGSALLYRYTNLFTVWLGLFAVFSYVVIYGYAKRKSEFGAEVGSIPGAIPPAAGYIAASGHFDVAALLVFLILVFWQMPHFFAIALFRKPEYREAGIPVLPLQKGDRVTKQRMVTYVFLFAMVTPLLGFFRYTGPVYIFVAYLLSLWWLWQAVQGFTAFDITKWARKMFGVSLLVLTVLSVIIALTPWLPYW